MFQSASWQQNFKVGGSQKFLAFQANKASGHRFSESISSKLETHEISPTNLSTDDIKMWIPVIDNGDAAL